MTSARHPNGSPADLRNHVAAKQLTPNPAETDREIVSIILPEHHKPADSNKENQETLFSTIFNSAVPDDHSPGVFRVATRWLGGNFTKETWQVSGSIHFGEDDGIAYSKGDDYIFAAINVAASDVENMEDIVQQIYHQLIEFCRTQGFSHTIRTWNYIPRINDGLGDQERYRRFTVGRGLAFDNLSIKQEQLPAGTAIGVHADSGLSISLLAGRAPVSMLNNSRQIDPFLYPREYGPRSPSFSRAALLRDNCADHVLLSGTASVVGHKSIHPGNVGAQVNETCANIQQLLSDIYPDKSFSELQLSGVFRLYLRNADDLPEVRNIHEQYFGLMPTVYLRGDICRRELLFETEAVIRIERD